MLVTLLIALRNDIDSIEVTTNKADVLSDVLLMVCEDVNAIPTFI